jgi:hypothetical protein
MAGMVRTSEVGKVEERRLLLIQPVGMLRTFKKLG